MPANLDPIYSRVGSVQWTPAVTAANTAMDGTGTVNAVWTADATNGGYLQYIKCKALGTNTQTVARFFINNGGANSTADNNVLFGELTLGSTTGSNTSALQEYTYPMNIAIPPGYKVNVTIGTAVAAGWEFSGVGGAY